VLGSLACFGEEKKGNNCFTATPGLEDLLFLSLLFDSSLLPKLLQVSKREEKESSQCKIPYHRLLDKEEGEKKKAKRRGMAKE